MWHIWNKNVTCFCTIHQYSSVKTKWKHLSDYKKCGAVVKVGAGAFEKYTAPAPALAPTLKKLRLRLRLRLWLRRWKNYGSGSGSGSDLNLAAPAAPAPTPAPQPWVESWWLNRWPRQVLSLKKRMTKCGLWTCPSTTQSLTIEVVLVNWFYN